MRQQVKEAQHTAEYLQSELSSREVTEGSVLQQTQRELLDLQAKFEQLSSESSVFQKTLGDKRELQTELTDNQV